MGDGAPCHPHDGQEHHRRSAQLLLVNGADSPGANWGIFDKVVAHAAVGCLSGELSSGNCGKGAFSAAASEYLGSQIAHVSNPQSLSNWGIAGETAKYALIGGATSAAVGGKFQEGFSVGAAGYLFNQLGGMHQYQAGPNAVCTAKQACTEDEIKDYMRRFAVPGQDPNKPVENNSINEVYDPRTGLYAGRVLAQFSGDGLTVTNTTLPGHLLYDGQIIRTATMDSAGAWSITTIGWGNNGNPYMAELNVWQGKEIFNYFDNQMRHWIQKAQ